MKEFIAKKKAQESAKHSLVLEWQLMYQNPFSGFLRVQGGHEQCFFFLIFVMLLNWPSSIRHLTQVWLYTRYENQKV
jgi:hypothetical protein